MNRPTHRPPSLRGTDLVEWIALRRVWGGGVARLCTHWFDLGRPVPCYLPHALEDLHRRALVGLADLDRTTRRRAVLTQSGYLRYAELTTKRDVPLEPPAGRIARGPSGQCLARPLPDHCPDQRPGETENAAP
ncbi:MAG: hypothetical protein ACRDOY_09700 [Nocardioidaceae bacterium]